MFDDDPRWGSDPANETMMPAIAILSILETPSLRSSTCLADWNVSWSAIGTASTRFAGPNPVR